MASSGKTPSSQADLGSGQNAFTNNLNSPLDFNTPSGYNRPSFADSWAPPPVNPPNSNPLDLNPQRYPNPPLPPLAGLYEQQHHSTNPYHQHHQQENQQYQQQYPQQYTQQYPQQYPQPYSQQYPQQYPQSYPQYPQQHPQQYSQQHHQQLPSIFHCYNAPTQNINDYRNQEIPSRVSARAGSALPGLDPGYRRQSSVNHAQHYSVAPPRDQHHRSSSSFVQNPHAQLPQPYRSLPDPHGDDHYLNALATGEFSSPSLPPINSSPRPPTRRSNLSGLPNPLEIGEAMPIQARDQRTGKGRMVDLTKEEPDSPSGVDPTTHRMPPFARKRPLATDTHAVPPKRRRSSASSPASSRVNRTKSKRASDASPFIDDELPSDPTNGDAHETIDLSNAADVPNDLLANKRDNRVKIGKFQCVICMDDASNLTVTHCGHLFCSECLHSALHIDNMKKTCPVCRTKVDPKDKKGKNQKSYYHLELKIMTANKKGKQPASSS